MKTGWKDMYFAKREHDKAMKHLVCSKLDRPTKKQMSRAKYVENHKANANIGSDTEIAAYLARVPKPYHYVEGDE